MTNGLLAAAVPSARGISHVWGRNWRVYLKNPLLNFAIPFLEPILTLAAIGFGIGSYVGMVGDVSYSRFFAPAVIGTAVMHAAFFECSYASYVRMYYQKTFDAITATPVTLREVVLGEVLWGATKGVIYAACILVVLAIAGLADMPASLLVIPLSLLAGVLFAAIAICFTAISPGIDALNYPMFLFITPMFLFCGTFFPLELLPAPIQAFAFAFLPLTHVMALMRMITMGAPTPYALVHLVWLLVATALFVPLGTRLMERRLIV
jgi:lipooligosaccharide transport system permease protein